MPKNSSRRRKTYTITSVTVHNDLKDIMTEYGHLFNWSQIACEAFKAALEKGPTSNFGVISPEWVQSIRDKLDKRNQS